MSIVSRPTNCLFSGKGTKNESLATDQYRLELQLFSSLTPHHLLVSVRPAPLVAAVGSSSEPNPVDLGHGCVLCALVLIRHTRPVKAGSRLMAAVVLGNEYAVALDGVCAGDAGC